MKDLAGKKLLLMGSAIGVTAEEMEECLKGCGAEFIFSTTPCPT